jgi:fatty acid desaturase
MFGRRVRRNEGSSVSGGGAKSTGQTAIEWPTVALLAVFFAAFLGIVLGHQHVPWPVQLAALVYLGGLWMSLGHELLHGHPTPWNWVNTSIGFIPLSFWVPFARYKTLHVKHHRADLTDPVDDPESFYVTPATWAAAGRFRRRWMMLLRTLAGRLSFGVPRGIVRYWWKDLHEMGSPRVAGAWALHLAASVAYGWWLFGVVGMNPWVYVFGFVLGGSACTGLRSFLEHNAVAEGTRSAVVKAGPVLALLFLNNNLHHTHHAEPALAWYRIPARHRELGSDALAAAGAGLYPGGYLEVARRYLFRPFGAPPHPLSEQR